MEELNLEECKRNPFPLRGRGGHGLGHLDLKVFLVSRELIIAGGAGCFWRVVLEGGGRCWVVLADAG